MAIVLVIIGLLVGGIMTGVDLVKAAAAHAQLKQIESYQAAVNAFRVKYNGLPGDLPAFAANGFGFVARGQYPGEGDGNGTLEGNCCNSAAQTASVQTQVGIIEMSGETTVFWRDLSDSGLIGGIFNTATETGSYSGSGYSGSAIDLYLPQAKIGFSNYLYVWSGGCCSWPGGGPRPLGNGFNYFGLSAVTTVGYGGANAGLNSGANIPVSMARGMDEKIDDGLPLTGKVTTVYVGCAAATLGYAIGTGDAQSGCGSLRAAKYASATTCYDNGNVSGAPYRYSTTIDAGSGGNCALSFQFN